MLSDHYTIGHNLTQGGAHSVGVWRVVEDQYNMTEAARSILGVVEVVTDNICYLRNRLVRENCSRGRRAREYVTHVLDRLGRLVMGPSVDPSCFINLLHLKYFAAAHHCTVILNQLVLGGQQWNMPDLGLTDSLLSQIGFIYYVDGGHERYEIGLRSSLVHPTTWQKPFDSQGLDQLLPGSMCELVMWHHHPAFTVDQGISLFFVSVLRLF